MKLEIHYADEWAALYVDGKLEIVGDSYLAEERALMMSCVDLIQDDSFMMGQRYRDGVARTVDEVNQYRIDREARREQAEKLRLEASRLLLEAELLTD